MDFWKDYYSGIKGTYFQNILNAIIKIGNLKERKVKILDFGCGHGKLKKILGKKVTGYDICERFSDVKDWRKTRFDAVVANEVFYLFTKKELRRFLSELYAINPKAELIVGISRQGALNKILAFFSERNALHGARLSPKEEISILKEKMRIMKQETVFFLCDVYLLKFKSKR